VNFLENLNNVQKEAATDHEGAHLIIAGAGSGKTRVLTCRIASLLQKGVPASSVMALTFTNKTAGEMKDRVAGLLGQEVVRPLWIGTFHSVFARILRAEASLLGYTSNFTIYDTVDSKKAIKKIIGELSLDDQLYKPAEVLGRISSAKNNLITAAAYQSNSQFIERDKRSKKPQIGDIFSIYAKRCFQSDAMDFDDLLLNTNILMRDFPQVLKKYQERFRYILVDEFQDTNFAQYLIVSKLAGIHRNICAVGDDAQSIYAFRGARIENMLNFKKDYPDHKIFKLEQNYRSTKTIVNAANSLIEKNRSQLSKQIWSDNETGDKIKVFKTSTDTEEGILLAESIRKTIITEEADYKDFAILYRTNAQSRIFEESLRKQNIPYKVYGSLSFYQRKEIKDLLAYFRLSVNQLDSEAFLRVVNYPARGIGKTTLEKLNNYAIESGYNLWEIVSEISNHENNLGLNRGIIKKLESFAGMIKDFAKDIQTENAHEKAMDIASKSGILQDLFKPGSPENITKYENIQELLNGIREFTASQIEKGGNTNLPAFLENVSLLTDTDKEKPEDKNKVTIMTVHSAKGLEFKYVFVAGMEEELFPSRFSCSTMQEIEEERRLFYVAITRAQRKVKLSFAQSRYRWGSPVYCKPSRFINEIDNKYLDFSEIGHIGKSPGREKSSKNFSSANSPGRNTDTLTTAGSASGKKLVRLEKSKENNSQNDTENYLGEKLSAGMTVEHQRFGKGKVLQVNGEPPNTKAVVFFQSAGQKQLLLKFAKLKVID